MQAVAQRGQPLAGPVRAPARRTPARLRVDLTGTIGTKRVCSIASRDYEASSSEPQDLCIVEHGGIHLIFEAEGTSNPLDSPSRLFVTDVDSACDVWLDEQKLEKGQKVKVKPGACMCMGQEARYVVTRNVFAHA
ncbi:D-lactate dehydrogenase (cytochrome) [Micractinium conductrix]|uniref:D-lactate dehydrogenase (Cytochrome) n=1 Tax=Micractinium conductrix TaxID=554055 RepID=A0A2P6V3J2_9CHLO|nr:D-lactate dehydrogenase (cytochrome) [Micractinium conductrix]|eukprot:PSC68644.1 D-lactate dehydrogenase (cytochrome) [Micractinium conductrix]